MNLRIKLSIKKVSTNVSIMECNKWTTRVRLHATAFFGNIIIVLWWEINEKSRCPCWYCRCAVGYLTSQIKSFMKPNICKQGHDCMIWHITWSFISIKWSFIHMCFLDITYHLESFIQSVLNRLLAIGNNVFQLGLVVWCNYEGQADWGGTG